MKFDTIIIGGGLAGLTCGIALQRQGVKCAIVSAGHSALHFSSGSFDLLNTLPDGTPVESPLKAMESLPATHPYAKIGSGRIKALADEAKSLLCSCGVAVKGDAETPHLRFTPMGTTKPTWLSFEEIATLDKPGVSLGEKLLIVNFAGFLDFNTAFIAKELEAAGSKCSVTSVSIPEINRLRINPTEMRATNIAKTLDNPQVLTSLITILNSRAAGHDAIVLPHVFGFASDAALHRLRSEVKATIHHIPTMPPSVPGIRAQRTLRHAFEQLGGVYMLGDTVVRAEIENHSVKRIFTENHSDIALTASHYVLASGHFFSKGLVATPQGVYEPVFGCDVIFDKDRNNWYNESMLNCQEYISFGVETTSTLLTLEGGTPITNLYAIGSVLGGCNAVSEGCGAGVALLTALAVAHTIKG